jgi:hypothetical protein
MPAKEVTQLVKETMHLVGLRVDSTEDDERKIRSQREASGGLLEPLVYGLLKKDRFS